MRLKLLLNEQDHHEVWQHRHFTWNETKTEKIPGKHKVADSAMLYYVLRRKWVNNKPKYYWKYTNLAGYTKYFLSKIGPDSFPLVVHSQAQELQFCRVYCMFLSTSEGKKELHLHEILFKNQDTDTVFSWKQTFLNSLFSQLQRAFLSLTFQSSLTEAFTYFPVFLCSCWSGHGWYQ